MQLTQVDHHNKVQYLSGIGSGLPVGLFEDAQYADLTQRLEANFKLLLSSDGIFEILPSNQLVDKEEQLRKAVQQCDSSLQGLVSSLKINSLESVPDDIALLSICGEAYA